MAGYSVSLQARRDLRDIEEFISDYNPVAADQLLARIDDQFPLLADNPFMGRERAELGDNLRSLRVENYVIIYRPADSGVEVVRVINGARDINRLF